MTTKTKGHSRKAAAPSDASLIRECVAYAQSIAAASAGFKADPDGSSKFASVAGYPHDRRADEALRKIARTKARTPEGLQAKARIVWDVAGSFQYGGGESTPAHFFRTFGAEVKEFLQSIVDENWRNKNAEKRLAA